MTIMPEWDRAFENLVQMGFKDTAKRFCNAAYYKAHYGLAQRAKGRKHWIAEFNSATNADLENLKQHWFDKGRELKS